jgi:hypothetical protein
MFLPTSSQPCAASFYESKFAELKLNIVCTKAKVSMCLTKYCDMETYGREEAHLQAFLTSALG